MKAYYLLRDFNWLSVCVVEQVKNAEKVQLDQIPLPEAPGMIPSE